MAGLGKGIEGALPVCLAGKFHAQREQLVRIARFDHEAERVVIHAQEARPAASWRPASIRPRTPVPKSIQAAGSVAAILK
ncbi:MAG: hypothetical protein R3E50_06120 [Halioglobus sp.]